MTQRNNNPKLEDAVEAMRNDMPEDAEFRAAGNRLWERMQAASGMEAAVEQIRGCEDIRNLLPGFNAGTLTEARKLLVQAHLRECVGCRKLAHQQIPEEEVSWTAPLPVTRHRWMPAFATAAATLVVLALSTLLVYQRWYSVPPGARAKVQSLDGMAYLVTDSGERALAVGQEIGDGQVVRTAVGSHAFLQLSDGSIVEVNERSEFGVKARGRDTTVDLDKGAVIVQAAKRKTGHLYVKTPDCRVAVTGTVFSVGSALKGSRVSVIEGEVHVAHAGVEDVLHAGDQVATSDSMTPIPVSQDIAWSKNLDKHLDLLAQFAELQKRFDQVPTPGPRYSSTLLGKVPANTVFYASIPNLGETLAEWNRIFQDQLSQSDALQQWWSSGHKNDQDRTKFNEMVEKIRGVSQYLGDEVVIAGVEGAKGAQAVVMADLRRTGLGEFLQQQFPAENGKASPFRVLDEHELATMTVAQAQMKDQVLTLARPDVVLFSPDLESLRTLNAQINAGTSDFANTDFGQQIAQAYQRGAGILIAANLQQIMADDAKQAKRSAQHKHSAMDRSGFSDMRYLIAEHREINNVPDNRLVLNFAGPRRGIASWLAAPAPMGSLEFVSPNAGLVVAAVSKSPEQMMNDVLDMAMADNPKSQQEIADAESKLQFRLREDLAASFGGDITFALDGPVLPTPSWKVVVEVYDPAKAQAVIARMVQMGDDEARQHGKPGAQLTSENVGGQMFYTIKSMRPQTVGLGETHYTFASGYMIIAPSRAIIMNALRTRVTGDSLARSAEFKALLPRDQNANYSAVAYQNLSPILQPLVSQLNDERAAMVQKLAADARPSVICAYGEQDRIEVASNSKLFGFDLLALPTLFGNEGTKKRAHP